MKGDCLYKIPHVVDENKQSMVSCLIKKKKMGLMLLVFCKINLKAEFLQLYKSTLLSLLPVSVQTELTWSGLELNSYLPAEEFSRHNYKCSHVINEENYDPEHVMIQTRSNTNCLIKFYLYEKILKILYIFHWGMDVNSNAKKYFYTIKENNYLLLWIINMDSSSAGCNYASGIN